MIEAFGWAQAGPLAAWFGGLLTIISLTLAFTILRRDRRKEISAQASKVSVHLVPTFFDEEIEVVVHNGSTQPISFPLIIMLRSKNDAFPSTLFRISHPRYSPRFARSNNGETLIWGRAETILTRGADWSVQMQVRPDRSETYPVVQFCDAGGVQWFRSLRTGQLGLAPAKPSFHELMS